MRTIRASEIGSYIYCRRAWWYSKNGVQPEKTAELLAGTEIHAQHGRAAIRMGCVQAAAYLFLLIAIVLVVSSLTAYLL